MLSYVLRRALAALATFFVVSLLVFTITAVIGNPVNQILPPEATTEQRVALEHKLGFDRPLPTRYLDFVVGSFTFDFGESTIYRRPASDLVVERVPTTLTLAASSLLIAIAIGIPLGIWGGFRPGQFGDRLGTAVASIGQALPTFLAALVLIYIFSVKLQWLPADGTGGWEHYILPALSLAVWTLAAFVRLSRSGIREAMTQPYVTLARAKGLREREVLRRHAFRNGMLPTLTFGGLQLGMIFTGAVVVESVFAIPGMGSLALDAVAQRDVALVQAVVMFTAAGFVIVNSLTDIAAAVLDPRIRQKAVI